MNRIDILEHFAMEVHANVENLEDIELAAEVLQYCLDVQTGDITLVPEITEYYETLISNILNRE